MSTCQLHSLRCYNPRTIHHRHGGGKLQVWLLSITLLFGGGGTGSSSDDVLDEIQVENLRSLPYATATLAIPDNALVGVTTDDEARACPGINLFSDYYRREVIDMRGHLLHRWDLPRPRLFYEPGTLRRNGDLLVADPEQALNCFAWDGTLRWSLPERVHHDVRETSDGQILFLYRRDEVRTVRGLETPVLADRIGMADPDGHLVSSIDLLPLFDNAIPLSRIRRAIALGESTGLTAKVKKKPRIPGYLWVDKPWDFLHTNSVQRLDRDISGFCRAGDLLVSVREIHTIAVIDPETKSIRWSWGPNDLRFQHHATLLPSNTVLIFDNQRTGYSRVIELDPVTKKIVWTYQGKNRDDFHSKWRGSAQRLPNGNTLIGESDKGRAFEVTPKGEIVWEFYEPVIEGKRQTFYRVERIVDPAMRAPIRERGNP